MAGQRSAKGSWCDGTSLAFTLSFPIAGSRPSSPSRVEGETLPAGRGGCQGQAAGPLTCLPGFSSSKLYDFYHYFYLVTNTLFYVSSAVTPVLYNAVSSSFRKLFLEALSSLCREHQPMKPFPPGAPEPRLSGHSLRLWGSPRNPGLDEIEE